MDTTNLKQAYFGFDDGPDYAGYADTSNRWNGWMQPYFTEDVLRIFIEHNEAERVYFESVGGEGMLSKLTFNDDGTVTVDDSEFYPNDPDAVQIVEPIDTDLGRLWPMALGWTWQVALDAPTDYDYVDFDGCTITP